MSDPDRSDRSDRSQSASGLRRRDVLRAGVAVSGTVGLAGCSFLPGGSSGTDTEGPTDSPTPTPFPSPSFSEDCLSLDPDTIQVEEDGSGGYRIVDGGTILIAFDEVGNANRAKDIIQSYGLTRYCFVGRPSPPVEYWLADDAPPDSGDASVDGEDCLSLDPDTIQVEEDGSGGYRIVDGSTILVAFDELQNANRARDVIRHYGFTRYCFVGRPNPPMEYWLTGE